MIEQDLGEQAAHGVAHDDRGSVELVYDALVVLDYGGDGQRLYRGGVLAQCLNLDLETWVGWGKYTVAAPLVVIDPLLPAAGGHPQTVDQDDGVQGARIRCVLGGHELLLESTSSRV
jgi:hypothetical protein